MLQRFESFKPRNIDSRQEKLKELNRKDEQKLLSLIPSLEQSINEIKHSKKSGIKMQYLKDTFQDVIIKYDFSKYPKTLFFFELEDGDLKYLAEYNLKEFWIKYSVFGMWSGYDWIDKMKKFIKTTLGLNDFVLEDGTNYRPAEEVEDHFMKLEQSNESFMPRNVDDRQEKLQQIKKQKDREARQAAIKLEQSIKNLRHNLQQNVTYKTPDYFSQKMYQILKGSKVKVEEDKDNLARAIMIYSHDNFWLIRFDLDWNYAVFYSGDNLYDHFLTLSAKMFSDLLITYLDEHLNLNVTECYRSAGEHPPLV